MMIRQQDDDRVDLLEKLGLFGGGISNKMMIGSGILEVVEGLDNLGLSKGSIVGWLSCA